MTEDGNCEDNETKEGDQNGEHRNVKFNKGLQLQEIDKLNKCHESYGFLIFIFFQMFIIRLRN
jgi:hypothetical protein